MFSKKSPDPRGSRFLRVTPRGFTRAGPDRVDSGGIRSKLEGRGQHGNSLRTSNDPRPSPVGCFMRGILPCTRVLRSTIDTSYPVRGIHTDILRSIYECRTYRYMYTIAVYTDIYTIVPIHIQLGCIPIYIQLPYTPIHERLPYIPIYIYMRSSYMPIYIYTIHSFGTITDTSENFDTISNSILPIYRTYNTQD